MSEVVVLWQAFSQVSYSKKDAETGKFLHHTLLGKGGLHEKPEDAWSEAQKLLDDAERFVRGSEGAQRYSGIAGICPGGFL
ncbi:hypothetical protein FJY94_04990 [Candidatus Kaiserbacteria bacterium]|nr:hypothetical protein [Candidatus Kaiserbacteria bacterium]